MSTTTSTTRILMAETVKENSSRSESNKDEIKAKYDQDDNNDEPIEVVKVIQKEILTVIFTSIDKMVWCH
jgi:uncharacterized ion transporter superfamily protein YfcC